MNVSASERPKRRWLRFSLRTLVIFVLLIGSAGGLWRRWEPWAIQWSEPIVSSKFSTQQISHNGNLFVATDNIPLSNEGDFRGRFRVFDAHSGREIWNYSDSSAMGMRWFELHLSPDEKWIAATAHPNPRGVYESLLFRAASGIQVDIGSKMWIPSQKSFSPDGKWLLTRTDGDFCVVELASLRKRLCLKDEEHYNLYNVHWVNDGHSIFATDEDNEHCRACVWDFDTGTLKKVVHIGEEPGWANEVAVVGRDVVVIGYESFGNASADKACIVDLQSNIIIREVSGRLSFASGVGGDVVLGVRRKNNSRSPVLIFRCDCTGKLRELGSLQEESNLTRDEFICANPYDNAPAKWFDLRTGEFRFGKEPTGRSADGNRWASLRGKRLSILDKNEQEIFYEDLPVGDIKTYAIQPFLLDDDRILTQYDHTWIGMWSRRRPEYWWGVAWLPEFWLTVLFAGALIWSVWRDRKRNSL